MNNEGEAINQKVVLHTGAGPKGSGAYYPPIFEGWKEIRFDINPACEPDIVGSIVNMKEVADESVDAVYSSHNIEHVHAHQVDSVLKEFHRVLRPDGFALITCPNLQTVCQLIVADKLETVVYTSPSGPIRPLDIIYGHSEYIARGNTFMQHKTGFTRTTLTQHLQAGGFISIAAKRRRLDLWAIATKVKVKAEYIRDMASRAMPS